MVVAAVGIGLSLQPPVDRLSGREAFEGGGRPLRRCCRSSGLSGALSVSLSTCSLRGSAEEVIGVAVFEAILNAGIRSRFSSIPGYGTTFTAPTGVSGYAELHALTDATTRVAVLTAFADSMKVSDLI